MDTKSKEFQELQDKWYKKLKDTGFEDAENPKNHLLKSFHSFEVEQNTSDNQIVNNAKLVYYRLAEHFLNSHKFKAPLQKFAWGQHSKGVSYRNIIKNVEKKYNIKFSLWAVQDMIQKLAKIMKQNYEAEVEHEVE